jgi:integrase
MTKATKDKVKNGVVIRGKTWSYVLRVPDPVTGKTKPKWVGGFATEKEAKLARDKARVALGTNSYIGDSSLTVGEFLTQWIELHAHQLKPSTLYSYTRNIKSNLIPYIGHVKLQDLRPAHVQTLYGQLLERGLAHRSVHYAGSVLSNAVKYAVDVEGLLLSNPVSKVAKPNGVGTIPTPWNFTELSQFLNTAKSHRLYFYFHLSAYTGARRGELCALRWSDFDGNTITINKSRTKAGNEVVELNSTKGGTNGQRRVALDPETVEAFNSHRKRQLIERLALGSAWTDTGYVFTREDGLPIDLHTPTHLFAKIASKAGLRPIRLHDLRHLHATELLRLGEPLHVVAQRLGHRDAMVTATVYAHVSDQQAETASSKFANAVNGTHS